MRKIVISLCAWVLFVLHANAQPLSVSGKVTDDKGAPIAAATILEKGTKNGTITNNEGSFTLKVKLGAKLIISALSFESKEVEASAIVNVQLPQDKSSLNEVVVTGVGVATSKRKLGISVESITADKLPAAPTASIDQALVGKIPGAQISSIDGTPGARTNILLRGINTVQRGTNPMILLDGLQLGATDLSQVDLNSVERIEVVQGAAAATIYGAQGANGVIQLFSKKGKQGKLNINFSTSTSFNSYINSGNLSKAKFHSFATDANGRLVDPNTGVAAVLDADGTAYVAWANGSTGWPSAMANPKNIANKPYVPNASGDFGYVDHFAQLFQTSLTTNNNINISGASDKSDFAIGLSNNVQESNIKGNGKVSRTNFSSNIGFELFKGLKLRSITQLVYTKNTMMPYYQQGRNNVYNMLNVAPFYDLNKPMSDGNFPAYMYAGPVSVNGFNFNNDIQYTSNVENTVDIIQNLIANYKVNNYLDLEAKYGINYQDSKATWIFRNQEDNLNSMNWGPQNAAWNYNDFDNTGEINKYNNSTLYQNFVATAYLKFNLEKELKLKFPFTSNTQLTYDYRKNYYQQYNTYGLSVPRSNIVLNMNQTASQAIMPGGDYVEPFVTYGFLANQKFDFGEFGGVSGGLRSDYSSAFGGGSKPQTFPRADGYIRPSSFNFWKKSKVADVISEWKVRAAYGEAGIQPLAFDRYPAPSSRNLGDGLTYISPSTLLDPNLNVEISKELELGTDVFFKMKNSKWFSTLNMSFVYWNRKSEGVIYRSPIAPSTGGSYSKSNALSLGSNGIQFSLNTMVYNSKNFTWDLTTNWGRQQSKVTDIIGPPITLTFGGGSTGLVLEKGSLIGQLFGYKAFTSLDERRKDGTPYIDKADYGKYQIVNGYVVDTLYKSIMFTNENYAFGDPNPKFNASFINSFTFKGYLTFGFQLDWIYGSHLYNQTREWMYRDGIHSDFDQPVTVNGVSAAYTAYYRSAYADMFGSRNGARNSTKDYFYENASFARLRNFNVGVDFAKLFKVKGFNKLQLVLSGRNVFTITKYKGFDPEVSSGSAGSSLERGVDHNSMPNIKSYQIGLNVGF